MTLTSKSAGIHIFYAGNKLSKWGKNPTSVETIGTLLMEHYPMILVSDKRGQIHRLADMILTLIINRKKVGVVLIDTYSKKAFFYAVVLSLVAMVSSIPYIPILRGGNLEDRIKSKGVLSHFFFNRSFKMVAPSGFLNEMFSKNGYSNVVVIPNTIKISDYEFLTRTTFRARLLWVRALQDIYQPNIAIHVLAILKKTYPDATMCMIGPDRGSLQLCQDLALKLGVSDSVTFPGKLSKAEWHERAIGYDIFLNTTSVDNTPVSVMEAMALGLPVVSTSVGGIPYLLEHGISASLVYDFDPQEFANEIQHIIENQDYGRTIVMNARAKVVSFDWDNIKSKWFDLLDSALH